MLRFLFLATLLVTLAVNIIFLFAAKDKPPDPPSTTISAAINSDALPVEAGGGGGGGEPFMLAASSSSTANKRNQRRLFLRSNDFYDYSAAPAAAAAATAGSQPPTTATIRTPAEESGSWIGRRQSQDRTLNESTSTTSKLSIREAKSSQTDRKHEHNKEQIIIKSYQVAEHDDDDDDDDTADIIGAANSIGLDKTNKDNETRGPKSLSIRVKSSKNHVFISVDGNVVYESKSRANLLHSDQLQPPAATTTTTTSKKHRRRELATTKSIEVAKTTITTTTTTTTGSDDSAEPDELARGIHVVVLNQYDGLIMSQRLFDTYSSWQDDELCLYLRQIQDGRIVVFAVRDEASFKLAQNSPARQLLQQLGSKLIGQLQWRDMWAFVVRKNTLSETSEQLASPESSTRWRTSHHNQRLMNLAEGLSKSRHFSEWAPPLELQVEVPLVLDRPPAECKWSQSKRPEDERRRQFCSRIEGYGRVCDCKYPATISFKQKPLDRWQLAQVPIVVIASNRPYYLFRMLRSLLQADGVDPHMITVFIDGFYEEPLAVCKLFNLRAVQQRPLASSRGSSRISHHYKTSLTSTFELFPRAEFVIIFEEDLDVSRDVMLYFNQTLEVLQREPSLYCVSAWNDQGYEHSSGHDPSLVYRIETMPGLGWMLSRRLYKEELEPRWPSAEQPHDWDMWIRTAPIRRGRECLIPDISRTFHFGSSGTNINSYFQRQYFSKHNFYLSGSSSSAPVRFNTSQLYEQNYERLMERLISEGDLISTKGQQLNATQQLDYLCSMATTPVDDDANLNTNQQTISKGSKANVIFIEMIDANDFRNWLKLAKCWRLWDLDARGQHRSTWRLFLGGRPLVVVGVPAAPYSHLKPAHLVPFNL